MSCCPNNITYFSNKTVTNVTYNGEFGAKPLVTVLYLQNGVWTSAGVGTQIKFIYGNSTNNINSKSLPMITTPVNNAQIITISVIHGGPATGIVKLQ